MIELARAKVKSYMEENFMILQKKLNIEKFIKPYLLFRKFTLDYLTLKEAHLVALSTIHIKQIFLLLIQV